MGSVYLSLYGFDWEQVIVGDDDSFGHKVAAIAFVNETFVALYGGQILTSTTGTNWTVRTPLQFPSFARAIAFGDDKLVVAGFGGEISQSRELSLPELSIVRASSGQVQLNLSGVVGRRYTVQRSENLRDWDDLLVVTNSAPAVTLTNLIVGGLPPQFFRARRD